MATESSGGAKPPAARILLVDDDTDILEELGEGLRSLGLPTRTAGSGTEALDLVRRHPELQVVVTDLQMPQIDGIELLQKLAARRAARPISAVVMTGNASLDRAVAALRLNAVDFLQKPLTPEEVATSVRRALDLAGSNSGQLSRRASRPEYLKALVAARADRDAVFKSNLFSDPVWEMLLDLAVAEACERWVSVTSLCLASGVATTTALRRIDDLQEAGLIEKFPDNADRRRILVRLTEIGRTRMEAVLEKQAARLGITFN